ncbi:MAG: hypothetical protein IJO21_03200 [Oscillospiraceae bacterium]|nr:hypothetical protein [Oscillospiraceae bacterium]MBQ7130034.1 hypothetical protein [Oscillospiraceae bacterium]
MFDSSVPEDFRLRPSRFSDPSLLEHRLAELNAECQEILRRLPQSDRAILEEYLTLLRDREDWQVHSAYKSGIQIGQRRKTGG